MKKNLFLILVLILACIFPAGAQTYEEYLKQQQQQYNRKNWSSVVMTSTKTMRAGNKRSFLSSPTKNVTPPRRKLNSFGVEIFGNETAKAYRRRRSR